MSEFSDLSALLSDQQIDELRRPELGQLAFDVTDSLRTIRSVMNEAVPQEAEIPAPRVAQAVQQLNALQSEMQRIRDFNVNDTSNNPAQLRIQIQDSIRNIKDAIVEGLRPVLRGDGSAMAGTLAETKQLLAESREQNERLSELLSRTRQGQVGEASDAASAFFEEQAVDHQKGARRFLIATVISTIVLVIAAIADLIIAIAGPRPADLTEAVVLGLPKVTLLVLLSFAVGFSARNYRINKHLEVLNRTKALTIKTADRYAASVTDDRHRDLVVETLVRSVFALGDTGYLTVDSERTIIETPGTSSLIASAVPNAT